MDHINILESLGKQLVLTGHIAIPEKKNDGFTRKEEGEIDVGWHQVVLAQPPPRMDIKKLV